MYEIAVVIVSLGALFMIARSFRDHRRNLRARSHPGKVAKLRSRHEHNRMKRDLDGAKLNRGLRSVKD